MPCNPARPGYVLPRHACSRLDGLTVSSHAVNSRPADFGARHSLEEAYNSNASEWLTVQASSCCARRCKICPPDSPAAQAPWTDVSECNVQRGRRAHVDDTICAQPSQDPESGSKDMPRLRRSMLTLWPCPGGLPSASDAICACTAACPNGPPCRRRRLRSVAIVFNSRPFFQVCHSVHLLRETASRVHSFWLR